MSVNVNRIIEERIKTIWIEISKLPNDKSNMTFQYEEWGHIGFSLGNAGYVGYSNEIDIGLNAEVRITIIENIWDDFAIELNLFNPINADFYYSEINKKLDGPLTYIFGTPHFLTKGIDYESFEDRKKKFHLFPYTDDGFKQLKEKYSWIYHDLFLPKLKETLNIKFLDSTINDKVEYLGGSSDDYFLALHGLLFRRMILAKLSGNPLYEDICEWNRGICAKLDLIPEDNRNAFQKNFRKVFEIVYERLKNVKPMDDTRLLLNLS
jgi:hypothetical protein